jgi:superfamily II DNA or RNA helicase
MKSCKIIIKDEVNIKVEGLELPTRKKLSNKFKFEIPWARYQPSYRLGRWDGTVQFFSIGGIGYLSHIEQILEILESEGYDIEVEDHRKHPSIEFDEIDENFWSGTTWPIGHHLAGQPIVLRDYQVEVINSFLKNTQSISEVATSAGKTLITATLSKLFEKYGRTLTIVPNKSLVEQTEEDFINCQLDVGVYYGDRKELNKTHTICTWQSLNALDKKTKDDSVLTLSEFLEGVTSVIVDEAHGVKGDVLKKILTTNLSNAPIRIGLTGTVPKEKFDFEALRCSLGDVANRISASELQERGFLSNCHINILQLIDFKEFRTYAEENNYLVTNKDRMAWIAEKIEKISEAGNTLVLVNRIETGKYLESIIPDSIFLSGETKTKDRKEEYDKVKIENNKVIIASFGIAAVGINIVRLFNLVLLEPGKSFVRVIQSIGRGIRKGADKDHVEIWDVASTCKYSKRHLTERKRYYKEAKYDFSAEKIDWQK